MRPNQASGPSVEEASLGEEEQQGVSGGVQGSVGFTEKSSFPQHLPNVQPPEFTIASSQGPAPNFAF
jgi:hypothetical protein